MQFNRSCLFRFCRDHYQEEKNISLPQEIHGLDQVYKNELSTSVCRI